MHVRLPISSSVFDCEDISGALQEIPEFVDVEFRKEEGVIHFQANVNAAEAVAIVGSFLERLLVRFVENNNS